MNEPILYAPGCDARTFNSNLKRFLADEVGVQCRVSVGNSTRKGVTVATQYVNARLDYKKVQDGTVKWPDTFRRLVALTAYPDLRGKALESACLGNISMNMITVFGGQWEQIAQAWYNEKKQTETKIKYLIANPI